MDSYYRRNKEKGEANMLVRTQKHHSDEEVSGEKNNGKINLEIKLMQDYKSIKTKTRKKNFNADIFTEGGIYMAVS